MNVGNPGRRAGALATMLALTVLAACGSGSGPTVAAGTTAYQKAVAYSECMRSHGEPDFPDPNSQGEILVQGPKDHLIGGSVLTAAENACKRLLPSGGRISGGQQQQALSQALKYAACMRAHGLPDFPDPVAVNGGIQEHLPSGTNVNSPQFQAANKVCQALAPGGAL